MADAVPEAQEAHAAARCDLGGSVRAFLNETALPAVRALNGAGAPTLLPAMHRIVNAIRPGLISPEAALYGHWMEWRESNRSGRPLSMGDTLRLTRAGSAMSLRSSAPALLHALRTRYPGDAAPYLNQARATYPGGVSELDAAVHLLHPPDEDLEVGEVTVFVEGADEASARPRPTNPVYDGTGPTPPYAVVYEAFPREPTWCPALPPATHAPRGWANPDLSPPLSRTRGAHHRGQVLWQECPGTPLLLLVVATRGDPGRILGITPTHLYGATPVPRPPLPACEGLRPRPRAPRRRPPRQRRRARRAREGLRPRPRRAATPPRPATPRPPARRAGGGRTPHGPRTPRRRPRQQQQWAGRARSTAPTPTPPTPTPAPPSRSPPSPSPRGGSGTSAPLTRERSPPGVTLPQLQRQRDARRVVQEGRSGGGEGGSGRRDRQGAGEGPGHGKGAQGRGQGAQVQGAGRGEVGERAGQGVVDGRRDPRHGQGAGEGPGHGKGAQGRGKGTQVQGAGRRGVGERAGQGVGDGRRDPRHGQGAGKGPKGKGKGAAGPKGQAGRGMGAQGGGRGEGRGAEGGAPPQPDVQPVRCIPPGIQQMPAHHTHHHHHHHHHHLYNIDPDAGELVPPQPPRHQHQQAPPAPRAEPARMASAEGGRGAASAPQAQGQRGGPARGGVSRRGLPALVPGGGLRYCFLALSVSLARSLPARACGRG